MTQQRARRGSEFGAPNPNREVLSLLRQVGDLLEAFAASYNDKHGRGLLDAPQLQVSTPSGPTQSAREPSTRERL